MARTSNEPAEQKSPDASIKKIPTRQRIMTCAVDKFAAKGYTETTIRDITSTVGINSSSLYNHFSSKEDLLEFILDDFNSHTRDMYKNPNILSILRENPTVAGVMSCIQISFDVLSDDYYSKLLHVIYQEQHRNDIVRHFVSRTILESEEQVAAILNALKDLNIISQEADPDLWGKLTSSLLYTFPNRTMLGIGSDYPGYSGMELKSLLHNMFELFFKIYGVQT